MTAPTLRLIVIFLQLSIWRTVHAQQCYYPNGSPVTAEPVGQCYAWGGTCCPVGWTCLSNNLCAYENQTGRYSCVDSDWGNSCPSFCRDESGSGGGNQAVQDCGGGKYCCNGRGLSEDACCETGTSFFTPGAATAVSTIRSAVSGDRSGDVGSKTNTRPTTKTMMTTTQTTHSVVSSEGRAPATVEVTVVSTSLITPNPSPASTNSSTPATSHSNATLDKAVVIPVALVAGLLIIAGSWLAYRLAHKRRMKRRSSTYSTFKNGECTTELNSPTAGEFFGSSPVSRQTKEALRNSDIGPDGLRVSELSGVQVLQVQEQPKIAELPVEGSGKA